MRSFWSAPTRDRAAISAIAVLGASNVLTNRWLPSGAYVPWNVAMSAGLVSLARQAGCHAADLGADPRHLRAGLWGGATGAVVIAAGYGLTLVAGVGAQLFRDDRVSSLDTPQAWWHLLMGIPLGTVWTEEVVFRGVLPAVLTSQRRPAWMPRAVASLLFGLWHVLPSRELLRANRGVGRAAGTTTSAGAVTLTVGSTALAGAVLHVLRERTGHLAAPMAVHLTANALGFVVARLTDGGR